MLGDEKAGTDEHDSRFDEIIIALKRELFAGGKQSILVSLSWLQVSEIDSDIDSKIDSEFIKNSDKNSSTFKVDSNISEMELATSEVFTMLDYSIDSIIDNDYCVSRSLDSNK